MFFWSLKFALCAVPGTCGSPDVELVEWTGLDVEARVPRSARTCSWCSSERVHEGAGILFNVALMTVSALPVLSLFIERHLLPKQ